MLLGADALFYVMDNNGKEKMIAYIPLTAIETYHHTIEDSVGRHVMELKCHSAVVPMRSENNLLSPRGLVMRNIVASSEIVSIRCVFHSLFLLSKTYSVL
jgi:hypothetical protein